MPTIALVPPIYFNPKLYGAIENGTTDDTAALQAAITDAGAAGGGYVLLTGLCAISAPLTLSSPSVWLVGCGPGSGLVARSSFTGTSTVSITADFCGVRDLRIFGGPSTLSGSNPAANAITATSARYLTVEQVRCYYVNGYAIENVSGSSVNNVGTFLNTIHVEHCAKGIHLQGVPGSNYVGQNFLSNIHLEVIDSGDGLFLEDINDVEVSNINGAVAGGSTVANMLHMKGNCNSCFFTNVDFGAITQCTVSPSILIESGTNGSPSNITLTGGVVQKGATALQVAAGSDLKFLGLTLKSSYTDGTQVTGGAGPVAFERCTFATNGQSSTTAYDVNLTTATGVVDIYHCSLQSPIGSGAGLVTNPVNDTNHRGYFFGTHFAGSGTTPSNVFVSGGTPQIVRSCPGYNPRGNITPQTIGASPFTGTSSQNDITIYFTAINGMTAFKIGGQNVGAVPVIGSAYRVPARQTFEIDYTGSPPTYLWIAD